MTLGPRLVLRLALLAFVGVMVQVAAVSQIFVFGINPDITPLLVAAVGYLGGAIAGAGFGFATGLLVDLALLQPLGLTSLLLVSVGYGSGRLREVRDPAHGLAPLAIGAAAAAVSAVGGAGLRFLLGEPAAPSFGAVVDIVLVVLLSAVLMPGVYALTRRVLLPYLPEEGRRRRRRAYTTGGLSPLSQS